MRILNIFMMLQLAIVSFVSAPVETGVRYNTFTLNNGEFIRTQTAYTPLGSQSEVYGVSLDTPNDIFIDDNNFVYIASTGLSGSGKIIRFNLENEVVDVIGEDFLINPTGVYVRDDLIYVADRSGEAAYQLDQDGNILQTYTMPNSPLFGDTTFQPRKILADARGNVFILNNGSRGLAQFTRDNEFLGYFGTNTIQPSFRTVLQYFFFTPEQRENLFSLTPPEISNMAIDQRGLIHTVSLGVENTGVKRLNINGDNLLPDMVHRPSLTDIYVGPIGNIYTISADGYMTEYDREGNLLFAFGGQDESNQIMGLFNVPSAIAVDDNFTIYALDGAEGELQIYLPTEFSGLVHQALDLYQDGNYAASEGPWLEVLKQNDLFDLAHIGLGNAYYSLGRYEEALEEFDIARYAPGYSDAFWEVRNAFLLANVGTYVAIFFVFIVLYVINMKMHFMRFVSTPLKQGINTLKKKSQTFSELSYMFYYLKNPADASYEIKRKDKVSTFNATLLLLIYFGLYIFYIYQLGFLFNPRNISNINLLEEILKVFLPLLLWVGSNYLIGSIREGEGRLKDVYVTSIMSLSPYFITLPIIAIISRGLTFNEVFLVEFAGFIALFVTVIYFFFMVKETHNYNIKETISSILISFFTMVMVLLGGFIVYILLSELWTLIIDLILEVYYRV